MGSCLSNTQQEEDTEDTESEDDINWIEYADDSNEITETDKPLIPNATLIIRTLKDTTFDLENINLETETIQDLKTKIKDKKGILVDQQTLGIDQRNQIMNYIRQNDISPSNHAIMQQITSFDSEQKLSETIIRDKQEL